MNKDEVLDFEKYKKSLKKMSLKQLEAEEQKIIKQIEDHDGKLKDKEFNMPSENYKIVAEAVRSLLNKNTVQWKYTLAMAAMYDFWDPEKQPKKIPYPQLDATLRTLGGMQFTGYEEWAKVIAINKYFEPLHEDYNNAIAKSYTLATKHSAILDEMQLKSPVVHNPDSTSALTAKA